MSEYTSHGQVIDYKILDSVEGFDLKAITVPDYDATFTIEEPEGEYAEQDKALLAAWERDEWVYVGLIVIASRAGVELGSASLWGTDSGFLPGVEGYVDPLTDGRIEDYDLVAEAISEAKAKIAEINAVDVSA